MKADAAVAAGNANCASAELMDEQHLKHALLQQACESYRFALGIDEDAMTHSNLGDALVTPPPPLQPHPRPHPLAHIRACTYASTTTTVCMRAHILPMMPLYVGLPCRD